MEVTTEKNLQLKNIETIIFGGGGIRCITYIGALKVLEQNHSNLAIKNIYGVSAGSIFGLMKVIGYSADEMQKVVIDTDFSKLVHISIYNLEQYGLDSGNRIMEWIEKLMDNKGYNKDITFAELYNKSSINYRVGTTNLTESIPVTFDKDSYPNLKVTQAIRMSISIPFIFSCVTFEDCIYIDGGVVDNFPIEMYTEFPDTTIGFVLTSVKGSSKIDTFQKYTKSIIRLLRNEKTYQGENCLIINTGDMSSTNFQLTLEDKQTLLKTGRDEATKFFKKF